MIDISVNELVKSFEVGQTLLDGLSFDIHEGECVGIMGRNGCGKTTLFRLLTGELSPDSGEIHIAAGKKLGLISQIPVYPAGFSVEDVLRTAFVALTSLKRRMEELEKTLEKDASRANLSEYDRLSNAYLTGGGYEQDTEVDKVCNGLGIPAEMRGREFDRLSGGEKTRVNLARLLLEKTDILLLDEPTNHLDLRSVEWLEDYIRHFKGTVLTISHDRYFLDQVVQRIIEISAGKAEFYSGNYSFYLEEKQERFNHQLRQYEQEQAKLKQLGFTVERMKGWGINNRVLYRRAMSIQHRMERIEKTERPTKEKTLRARFGEKEFHGDEVLTVKNLSKQFGGRTLFSGVELTVRGGERIALLGDNGTGKTTFLRVLLGELPAEGKIKFGPSVKSGYLPQVIHFAHPERTLYDTMLYEKNCTPQTARDRLGAFLFSGEDVFKTVGTLSGGEQSRLRLCMLMDEKINLLVLDEPTNHLDVASREWIECASADEEGIYPAVTESGIQIMSVNLLLEHEDDPVLWRGPIIAGAVKQFWTDVVWENVDYLFVDMPPGTGDVPLTVFQSLPVDGIVIVTSPQELVSLIVAKAVRMAEMMHVPVIGLVENYSYFRCPDCGKCHQIFGKSHLDETAQAYHLPVLARLPIDPAVAEACDAGRVESLDTTELEPALQAILAR